MGFLTDADFDDLPADDADAFAKLERISHDRLQEAERDGNGGIEFSEGIRYMNEVSALAEQFGIGGIAMQADWDSFSVEFARFTRKVDFSTTKIRAARARRNQQHSVALSSQSRLRVQSLVEKLKGEITTADIPAKRKRDLLNRLAEFERELSEKRIDFAKAMAIAALVTAAVHDFAGALLDAPKVIHEIQWTLGDHKVKEEEQRPAPLLPSIQLLPNYSPTNSTALICSPMPKGLTPARFKIDDEPS